MRLLVNVRHREVVVSQSNGRLRPVQPCPSDFDQIVGWHLRLFDRPKGGLVAIELVELMEKANGLDFLFIRLVDVGVL